MIKNFLTTAFRGFMRNINHTLINILGLGVGLAACIVIFIIVQFEVSFDTFHSKYDRIYRVVHTTDNASGKDYSAATPYPFIHAFRNDFADIPLSTQFHYQGEAQMSYGGEKMKVESILFADSLFFEVFDFGIVSGNPRVDLGQPGKVFLTESLAKKITKGTLPKTIKLNNKIDLEIAGIVNDPPAASHLTYTMIASMASFTAEFMGLPLDEWGMTGSAYSYAVLPEPMNREQILPRFESFVKKYYDEESSDRKVYDLQPLSDIHFGESYASNVAEEASMTKSNLLVLSLLGAFILLVACINFINLSTALASRKSREIGVRKTLGANRSQLTGQFLLEALLITMVSTILAIGIVDIIIQPLATFLEKDLPFGLTTSPLMYLFLLGLVLLTTFLAGLYPAFVLSRFNPITALKSKFLSQGASRSQARQYLVMFQFLVAQVMIVGTLVMADQLDYFQSKPLGFTKDAIINITLPENKKEQLDALQTQLATTPGVEAVSFSLGAPTSDNNFGTGFYLTERGKGERFDTHLKPVDHNYLSVYGIEMAAGRWYTENDSKISLQDLPKGERVYSYVVNEALVRQLGFATAEEIIGKNITTGLNDINATIIGVVKDFHVNSLHKAVEPTVLVPFPYFYYDAGVRVNTSNIKQVIAALEKAYLNVFPDFIFKYSFLDEHIGTLYRQEARALTLIRILTGLSIFISCLGLFGLVSFLAQQKIKEVGIRKVFGASIPDILLLFSRSFVGIIFKAFVIAAPLSYYLMDGWLSSFAYRTAIGYDVFLIAVGSTLLITLLTVGYQSARAAVVNPVNSLRNE